MIKLDVKPYCQNGCMCFEMTTGESSGYTSRDDVVVCKNAKQCEYLIRYLKNNAVKGEDNVR